MSLRLNPWSGYLRGKAQIAVDNGVAVNFIDLETIEEASELARDLLFSSSGEAQDLPRQARLGRRGCSKLWTVGRYPGAQDLPRLLLEKKELESARKQAGRERHSLWHWGRQARVADARGWILQTASAVSAFGLARFSRPRLVITPSRSLISRWSAPQIKSRVRLYVLSC